MRSNLILPTLKSNNLHREAVRVFEYAFIDVSKKAINKLIEGLKSLSVESNDTSAASYIENWYSRLPKEDLIGFPMTDEEYQAMKASKIVTMITHGLPNQEKKKLQGKALLDIGAGDCAMTHLVSEQLHMESWAIDVQTSIDWGGQNSSDKLAKNEYMAKIHKHCIYDGHNLLAALGNKKFKVIMLNHSLHHFPSFDAQQNCFKQIASLLEPNGILFLSEHANCHNDIVLELSHLLLNLRYSMDKIKANSNDSCQSFNMEKFKEEYGIANYLSKNMVDLLAKKFGFQAVIEEIRIEDDIVKTVYYCLRKENPKMIYSFFDDSTQFTSRLKDNTSKAKNLDLRATLGSY
ncbi:MULTISPECIES: methyltransferase domain-containing protein [unclassified Legionella]|uniref:methyltransferase domain-containing protein n=1 Tax=unclassified Legionella TaxID=2622702 RepID=UPI001055380E|nr:MULTISPECIES: methyltransferase domain-containing protein [unclassified Legionella]MDI9818869.1 methyltransferase domain-containing protein [Legionella sp. PL877]